MIVKNDVILTNSSEIYTLKKRVSDALKMCRDES